MEESKNAEYGMHKEPRHKVLPGEIKEGERLVETTLAADFHANRLHIKSILYPLEQESLAQHTPQYGLVTKRVTEEATEGIAELRTALKRIAFKRLVQVTTDEEIAQLRETTQRVTMFLWDDMAEDAVEEVGHFYSFVYEKGHLERITSILDTYTDYLRTVRRRLAFDIDRNQVSMQLLQDIMGVIEKRDAKTLLCHTGRRRTTADQTRTECGRRLSGHKKVR